MKSDIALINFAVMIHAIQNDKREKMAGLDICIDFATTQRKAGVKLSAEHTLGLADKLSILCGDGDAGKTQDAAEYFVNAVWPEVFDSRIPGNQRLSNIKAIYRGSFSNPRGAGRKKSRWPKGMGGRGKVKAIQIPVEIADDVLKAADILAWNDTPEDRLKAFKEWI